MKAPRLWVFGLAGIWFGVVLVKAEVLSWFRIQEMFRFDAFHMYGVIGSAIAVGAVGRWLLGEGPVRDAATPRHMVGGTIFGLGWGLTGACPGPMYALIGYGVTPYAVVLVSAIVGTWTYGRLRDTRLASHPMIGRSLNLN
ncbi:MAG: YeeE/YedE family protein [Acidobacteria bacterium]|nr:YeeE/YedE family protein [Acidobacteriota bacterium]